MLLVSLHHLSPYLCISVSDSVLMSVSVSINVCLCLHLCLCLYFTVCELFADSFCSVLFIMLLLLLLLLMMMMMMCYAVLQRPAYVNVWKVVYTCRRLTTQLCVVLSWHWYVCTVVLVPVCLYCSTGIAMLVL